MRRDGASVSARGHDIALAEETKLMAESPRQMTRRQFLMSAAAGGIAGSHTPSLLTSGSAEWRPLDRRLIPAGRSLSAVGSTLVNAAGQEVGLTGVNWFGMETSAFAPHGLWERNWKEMLDQIAASGFNMLRLPFNNQLLDPSSQPNQIDFHLNPDLKGLRAIEILDTIISGAGLRGLKVVLDRHRPTPGGQSPLWYTGDVSEDQWIQDWVALARRYLGNSTILGADLHNEPHNPATWGDGNVATDWRLAAERAGNAILAVNPELLVFVQGVQQFGSDWACWGGNLVGARAFPVRLIRPEKLVYSPHDFGPSVSWQPWFSSPTFPANLPSVWRWRWAYLQEEGIAPVWLGEFGGRSLSQDVEGAWTRALVTFLRSLGIGYAYWAWNSDSGDTAGMLLEDWHTIDLPRLHALAAYQAPPIRMPFGLLDHRLE
jgi:endoglucanase